jgi:hypothetical protein
MNLLVPATGAPLGDWIIQFAAVLAIFYMVFKIVVGAITVSRRRHPIDAEFTTKRECAIRSEKVDERLVLLSRDLSEKVGGVHRRLDDITKSVYRVEGQIKEMGKGQTDG